MRKAAPIGSIRTIVQYTSLIVALLLFNQLPVKSNSYSVVNFSREHYNAEYQNWSLDAGSDNFIYFANNSGLVVFDGVNWEFYADQSIKNIRAVKADKVTGRIYTAGYREIGYWVRDSLGILQYQSLTDRISHQFTKNEEFWKILIHQDKIIFQSFQSIFILQKDSFHLIRPSTLIQTITLVNDKLLVNLRNSGIYEVIDGSLKPYFNSVFFVGKQIRFLLPYKDDALLIGTASDGIFLLKDEKINPFLIHHKHLFEDFTINKGTLLQGNILLIGTTLNGLFGFNPNGKMVYRINEDNSLQNNTVLDIMVHDENIWLALDRGISFVELKKDPSYEIHPINEIGAVYDAAFFENYLYLATNQGLYRRSTFNTEEKFNLVPHTQNQVWDLTVIDEDLFIGHNNGTYLIKNNQLKQVSNINGGFCIIKNPFQLNTLIQSTYSNLVFYRKIDNNWINSHTIANFTDLIRYIELDHLNNLWASHMHRSIYKLKLNDEQDTVLHSTYYGKSSILNNEYGNNVFKIENRIVFTTGGKILTYDDLKDSIIPYTQLNKILGKFSTSHKIVKAPDHHYWFIASNALGLFKFELNNIRMITEIPMSIFGNHFIEGFENIVPVTATQALLCLENGYAVLYADSVDTRYDIKHSELKLNKIARYGKEQKMELLDIKSDTYTLNYSKNNLYIQFAFPYYSTRNIGFRYYVEGLDARWSQLYKKPEFEFTRIPPGQYLFKVVSVNEWNEQSDEYLIHIHVLQPWYSSLIAWIIYIVASFGLLILIRFKTIQRIHEREKTDNEHKEQELIKLRNENLRTKLSYKSKQLANSTMSIIKKNEFLLELKRVLRDQKIRLGTRYPERYYSQLISKIDKNISRSDDWLTFESNLEEAHDKFLQKLMHDYPDLTHSDLRLCTYLRMNLTSKEIAPLMRISVRGVENHRYRIRKKLHLESDENLTDFILGVEV